MIPLICPDEPLVPSAAGVKAASAGRKRQKLPVLTNTILLAIMVGGSFLAFRWSSPIGNVTIARVGVVMACIGIAIRVIRLPTLPSAARPVLGSSLAVVLLLVGGLFHSPALSTGVVIAGNVAEALAILLVTLLLAYNLLRGSAGKLKSRSLARVPLWGFLPTGLLGVWQALQLLAGSSPTIPLLEYARLDQAALNSARTAFHSGLNQFGVDRVAAAMGDPATYGVFSAAIVAYCLWVRRAKLLRPDGLFWMAILLGLLGVVLSASAAAVVVLTVALLCSLPDTLRSWHRCLAALVAVIGASFVLLKVLPQAQVFVFSAQERLTQTATGQGSVGAHLSLLADGWAVFSSHPLLGVGTGGFGYHQFGYDPGFSSVHNTLLLGLAEGGVLLGSAMVLFWITLWRRLVPHAVLLPLTAAWLIYLDFNRLPALWAMIGVAAALNCWQRRQARLLLHAESCGARSPSVSVLDRIRCESATPRT